MREQKLGTRGGMSPEEQQASVRAGTWEWGLEDSDRQAHQWVPTQRPERAAGLGRGFQGPEEAGKASWLRPPKPISSELSGSQRRLPFARGSSVQDPSPLQATCLWFRSFPILPQKSPSLLFWRTQYPDHISAAAWALPTCFLCKPTLPTFPVLATLGMNS